MRIVLDTNILISGLLSPTSAPASLLVMWRQGRCELLTAANQLDELIRVTRYPKIRARLNAAVAGRLINDLRELATLVESLPPVDVSPDPYDNYLLAIASKARADYLITGDKRDLLGLKKYDGTAILSVSMFLEMHPQ